MADMGREIHASSQCGGGIIGAVLKTDREITEIQSMVATLLRGLDPNAVNIINGRVTPEVMVCMGMDAIRIAMGQPTKNYPAASVIQFLIIASAKQLERIL